jgi:hypothetical protein
VPFKACHHLSRPGRVTGGSRCRTPTLKVRSGAPGWRWLNLTGTGRGRPSRAAGSTLVQPPGAGQAFLRIFRGGLMPRFINWFLRSCDENKELYQKNHWLH